LLITAGSDIDFKDGDRGLTDHDEKKARKTPADMTGEGNDVTIF
jgi:hypothetical protein